ncbi:Panacea domain-containing protein [Methanoplanus endosymbiosus]|uniref:Panacea domain-containing protein n=1 Tax=Methanoplanus endosymbiosus TaxID=33865 RepID=A0A9E7PMK7_9EURY|nr:Panacea domain-containing protein [Methanoplanus endosymbiosus]UUX92993.1 Panacea domain-containing protein [Methanoplanus endosymbiosus]
MEKMRKIQAILFAIGENPHIGKTVLMKYIFFTDLIYYNQRGSFLFNSSQYIRLPNGPVDSEALAISTESNQYFAVEIKNTRYRARSKTYLTWNFRAKQPCDLSYFTPYERKLMKMVLIALKNHQARQVSDLTHRLRLWKEFSDGDAIPVEYFSLTESEIALLESHGLYIDGFQRKFCGKVIPVSKENADAIHPLNPERIASVEEILDNLIKEYPLPVLDAFYDAYLAWDDAFRRALRINPDIASELTEKGCDAVCYVSASVSTGDENNEELNRYCEMMEDDFNRTSDELLSSHSYREKELKNSLLEQTMGISRSMATSLPPSGRR